MLKSPPTNAEAMTLAERLWRAGIPHEFTLYQGDLAGKRLRVVNMDDRGGLVVKEVADAD